MRFAGEEWPATENRPEEEDRGVVKIRDPGIEIGGGDQADIGEVVIPAEDPVIVEDDLIALQVNEEVWPDPMYEKRLERRPAGHDDGVVLIVLQHGQDRVEGRPGSDDESGSRRGVVFAGHDP